MQRTGRQLASFAVIGAIGFLVDSGVLYAGLHLGSGKYLGRILSYLCAVTVTWSLNRRFTFAQRDSHVGSSSRGDSPLRQWAAFALSQLSGGAVNLLVYGFLVASNGLCAAHPVLAVGAGSIAGLAVNFFAARRFVYRPRSTA